MATTSRPSGLLLQRHEVVAEHEVHFDLAEQFVLDVEVLQVDELAAIAPRQILAVLDLVADRDATVTASRKLLLVLPWKTAFRAISN